MVVESKNVTWFKYNECPEACGMAVVFLVF